MWYSFVTCTLLENKQEEREQHLLHMCHPVQVIGRTLWGTLRPGRLTVWGQTRAAPLQSGHAGTSHHVDNALRAVDVLYNVIYIVLTTVWCNGNFLGTKCSCYKEHLLYWDFTPRGQYPASSLLVSSMVESDTQSSDGQSILYTNYTSGVWHKWASGNQSTRQLEQTSVDGERATAEMPASPTECTNHGLPCWHRNWFWRRAGWCPSLCRPLCAAASGYAHTCSAGPEGSCPCQRNHCTSLCWSHLAGVPSQ